MLICCIAERVHGKKKVGNPDIDKGLFYGLLLFECTTPLLGA